MTTVSIGDSSAALLLGVSDSLDYLRVCLECGSLRAEASVYRHHEDGFDDLADFFGELERDWRGWDGVRTWTSLEGDLRLRARHRGRIELSVELRYPVGVPEWSVTAHLSIEPGEQLSRVVAELRAFGEGSIT